MDINETIKKEYPPEISKAIVNGFNTIANHAYLILLPFLLDVFLWLGPNLSAKNAVNIFAEQTSFSIQQLMEQPGLSAEQLSQLQTYQLANSELVNTFDLFSFLNTLPIGVPSLLSFRIFSTNPLGPIKFIPTTSISQEFLYLVGLLIIGSFLGGIFFSEIGRRTNRTEDNKNFSFTRIATDIGWMMMINFAIWIAFFLIVIPLFIILIMLIYFLPQIIGNELILSVILLLILFSVSLAIFWTIIPLIFTPHGVIIQRQNPIKALLSSIRLIRFYLPGTGFFLLLCYLIYQVLNIFLWLLPETSSYMLLGGIFGHAFICSGLLASSYIYYQDGLRWMNHNLKMIAQQSNQTSRPFQA